MAPVPLAYSPYPGTLEDPCLWKSQESNMTPCPKCKPGMTTQFTQSELVYDLLLTTTTNEPTKGQQQRDRCHRYACLSCGAQWYSMKLPQCKSCCRRYTLTENQTVHGQYVVDARDCGHVKNVAKDAEMVDAYSYVEDPTNVIFFDTPTPATIAVGIPVDEPQKPIKTHRKGSSWWRRLFCCGCSCM
jgi:hypothetical protein